MAIEKSRVEEFVGEPVLEFSVSPGCKEGDGMASSLKSIYVKTTSKKEHWLVLKEIDQNSPFEFQRSDASGAFRIENLAYSTLIPMMTEFAKSRGVEAQIPVPRVYSTYKGTNKLDNYICLEDVRPKGYRMTDKYAGLTVEEMMLVMTEIGNFHALSYALIKWEGEKIFDGPLETLMKFYSVDTFDPEYVSPNHVGLCDMVQGAIQNGMELLKKRNETLAKKLEAYIKRTASAASNPRLQFQTSYGNDVKYFPVITHNDVWQNNIMFKYDSEGRPTSLQLLDFQFCRRGNIYDDLLYIVYTSTTPEFRRHNLLPGLHRYYECFCKRLQQLKTHRPIGFTLEQFLDTFMQNRETAYRYMVFAIPLQLGKPIPQILEMIKKTKANEARGTSLRNDAEQQAENVIKILELQLETSEEAFERFESLTQEMVELKVI